MKKVLKKILVTIMIVALISPNIYISNAEENVETENKNKSKRCKL